MACAAYGARCGEADLNQLILSAVALSAAGILAGALMVPATAALSDHGSAKGRRRLWLPLGAAAIGAGSVVWSAAVSAPAVVMAATAVFGWLLLLIAFVDAENLWLPDLLTVPLGLLGLLASVMLPSPFGIGWMASLAAAVFAFVTLWLMAFVYRKVRGHDGLGGGDPFLFGAGAAWVGFADLMPVLLVASAAGLGVAWMMKLRGADIGARSKLPYGTYLALGFVMMWLWP